MHAAWNVFLQSNHLLNMFYKRTHLIPWTQDLPCVKFTRSSMWLTSLTFEVGFRTLWQTVGRSFALEVWLTLQISQSQRSLEGVCYFVTRTAALVVSLGTRGQVKANGMTMKNKSTGFTALLSCRGNTFTRRYQRHNLDIEMWNWCYSKFSWRTRTDRWCRNELDDSSVSYHSHPHYSWWQILKKHRQHVLCYESIPPKRTKEFIHKIKRKKNFVLMTISSII